MTRGRGTAVVVRAALRQDRVRLPVWVGFLGLMPALFVWSFEGLYPTAADRARFAATSASNGAFVALYGPLTGSSIGQLVTWRAGFVPVIVALVAGFLVVRHSRAEEEDGRRELIGSTGIGRAAPLVAAVTVGMLASVVVGVVVAVTVVALGQPAAGAAVLGGSFATAGIVFSAVAAAAAQVSTSARTVRGVTVVAVGGAWVLRLLADLSATGNGALRWLRRLTPFGWIGRADAFGADRAGALLPPLVAAAAILAGALAWSARRDLGAGFVADRPGPAVAGSGLGSVGGLAWRLQRGSVVAWTVGMAVLGLVFGAVASGVDTLVADNPALRDAFARLGGTGSVVDSYLASTMVFLGLFAAAQAVQGVLRLRDEEVQGHAEALLALPVSRRTWIWSHVRIALLGPLCSLAVGGFVLGLTRALDGGGAAEVAVLAGAAVLETPAVWIVAGLALAIVGAVPRRSSFAWGTVGACAAIALVSSVVRLGPIADLSPFSYVPHVPAEPLRALPMLLLTVLAVVVIAAAVSAIDHRDLTS